MIKTSEYTYHTKTPTDDSVMIVLSEFSFKKQTKIDKLKQIICELINVTPDKYAGIKVAEIPSSYIEDAIWTARDFENIARMVMYKLRNKFKCVPHVKVTSVYTDADSKYTSIGLEAYIHYRITDENGNVSVHRKHISEYTFDIYGKDKLSDLTITSLSSSFHKINPDTDIKVSDDTTSISEHSELDHGREWLRTHSGKMIYTTILEHISTYLQANIYALANAVEISHGDTVQLISCQEPICIV